jgi:hypothetical protein
MGLVLFKRDIRVTCSPFHHVKIQQEDTVFKPGNRSSPDIEYAHDLVWISQFPEL